MAKAGLRATKAIIPWVLVIDEMIKMKLQLRVQWSPTKIPERPSSELLRHLASAGEGLPLSQPCLIALSKVRPSRSFDKSLHLLVFEETRWPTVSAIREQLNCE